jgi:nucleoside-diphosphate-sugar epimerase
LDHLEAHLGPEGLPTSSGAAVAKRQHRFLVTGAAGFIGANLCHRLVGMGEEVHVLVKPATDTWRIDELQGKLHVHEADICDEERVDQIVDSIRPTVVYHLATHGAYHYQDDTEAILHVNVFGLWSLVSACSRVGFDLFVNTGSSSEYGRKAFAMRETDTLDPNSFYGMTKAAQTLLCRQCARMSDSPLVTLRPFSVYGQYEEGTRLIPQLMLAAVDDRPIDMVSPNTVRDFVHVDDVVDVYLMIDELKALGGETLNVGTGVQTSLSEVVATAEEVSGKRLDARWGRMEPRPWDSEVWVADVSKLRRLTGSVPRTTVRDGLGKCLSWYGEHRESYCEDP